MMHTPEEKALIEAVGKWKDDDTWAAVLWNAYDAYMASLVSPPPALPPAPSGQRWVRVEYPLSFGNADNGDYLVYPVGDPVRRGYTVFDSSNDYAKGLAQALRHGWRLEDDQQADSLEKIADELAAVNLSGDYANRIRALIGEGQK